MREPSVDRLSKLDEDALDALDRRLTIEASKLTPGDHRRVRGPGGDLMVLVPAQIELDTARTEIIDAYRQGVRIASNVESRPLIPLFKAAKVELPPELKVDHEQMRYQFYSVEVTFSILLSKDQYPLSAELELNLVDDVGDPVRRTRPIRLFPGRKDIQLFNVNLEAAIGIDAGLNISIPMAAGSVLPFAKVAGDAKLKGGIVIGPFQFPFRKTAIEVRGESDTSIFWRYNLQSELSGANDFKSLLVLKVPEEARSVEVGASLGVIPYRSRWIMFKDILPTLSDRVTLPIELALRSAP